LLILEIPFFHPLAETANVRRFRKTGNQLNRERMALYRCEEHIYNSIDFKKMPIPGHKKQIKVLQKEMG